MKFKLKWLDSKKTLFWLLTFLSFSFSYLIGFWNRWDLIHKDLFAEIRWMFVICWISGILSIIIAVLLAARFIYLCVDRSLYKKKLDIRMNNTIVILIAIYFGIGLTGIIYYIVRLLMNR